MLFSFPLSLIRTSSSEVTKLLEIVVFDPWKIPCPLFTIWSRSSVFILLVGKLPSFSFPCVSNEGFILFTQRATSVHNYSFLLDTINPQLIKWWLIFLSTNSLRKRFHEMGIPLRGTKSRSSSSIVSPIAMRSSFNWEFFIKNVLIASSFVIFDVS